MRVEQHLIFAMGTEIYWHGILDYSGRENRRIAEVRQIHEKLQGMKERPCPPAAKDP